MRRLALRLLALGLFLLLAGAAIAQQFSADVVSRRSGVAQDVGKIYVSTDMARFEPQEMAEMGGVILVNLATNVMDVVMPQRRVYMERTLHGPSQRQPFVFFRPTNPENACDEWLKVAAKPGSTCHLIGPDLLNGRPTIKYQGASADGKSGTVWVDPKLRFAVKWEEEGDSTELRNIKEGSQPDKLFKIPADYQKMDMPGMMRMPQQ